MYQRVRLKLAFGEDTLLQPAHQSVQMLPWKSWRHRKWCEIWGSWNNITIKNVKKNSIVWTIAKQIFAQTRYKTKASSSQGNIFGDRRPKKRTCSYRFVQLQRNSSCEFSLLGLIENYLEVLSDMHAAIRRKWPKPWRNNSWILHRDNAPAYTAMLIEKFLVKCNTVLMPSL